MDAPRVSLVGAGPGHPGLLTLRAVECLARADLVVYDRLVPVQMLEHAPATAERVCVNELADRHADRYVPVHRLLIDTARQGKYVVRLKGGDPFVFGRGGEEAEELRQAGIPYEIVPGVTAGLAAAAFAGVPLTHRAYSSAVAFVTGHEDPDKPGSALDWECLARFPGTLVFYMGIAQLPRIVQALLDHGKPAATPAAVVRMASTGEQRTVEAPLDDLPAVTAAAGITAPAVTLIGPVVALRPRLKWFEAKPLLGRRVLVTRPRLQAGEMVRRLEAHGAIVSVVPVVEIRAPADWGPADRALTDLARYRWLVFTSANGVHAVVRRLRQLGRDLRALGPLQLACIGPGTADALRTYHVEPDLVPPEYRSESLARALKERVAGQRVLLARADRGREVLRDELAAVADVEQVAVYSQSDAVGLAAAVPAALLQGAVEFVTLTSSNIARAFLQNLSPAARQRIEQGATRLITISPVTSDAVREYDLEIAAEAREYTTAGVVEALVRLTKRTEQEGVP